MRLTSWYLPAASCSISSSGRDQENLFTVVEWINIVLLKKGKHPRILNETRFLSPPDWAPPLKQCSLKTAGHSTKFSSMLSIKSIRWFRLNWRRYLKDMLSPVYSWWHSLLDNFRTITTHTKKNIAGGQSYIVSSWLFPRWSAFHLFLKASKVIRVYFGLHYTLWLVEKLAPHFQPIRRKNQIVTCSQMFFFSRAWHRSRYLYCRLRVLIGFDSLHGLICGGWPERLI